MSLLRHQAFIAKKLKEIGKIEPKPKMTNLTPKMPQNLPRAKNGQGWSNLAEMYHRGHDYEDKRQR